MRWTLRKEFELYEFCKQRLAKQLRLVRKAMEAKARDSKRAEPGGKNRSRAIVHGISKKQTNKIR